MNTEVVETSMRISQAELQNSVQANLNSAFIPRELTDSLPVNDISDQIREAVIHLQRDLDGVTARVRSLEVSALSGSLHNSVVSDYKLINWTYSPGEKHQGLKCVLTTEGWFVQGPAGIRPDQKVPGQMLWNQLPNLPWWWMYPLHCRPLLVGYIFSKGSSIAGCTSRTPFQESLKVPASP